MTNEISSKIDELFKLADELAKARSDLEAAKSKLSELNDRDAKLRLEIREDPDGRELFHLRKPRAKAKKEG